MEDFYPLYIVPGIPFNQGIRFLHPQANYDIATHTESIWAILAECNGYEPMEVVVAKAQQSGATTSEDVLLAIVADLRHIGVLVDSREAYQYFHEFGVNPMPYSCSLRPDELRAHVANRRLRVKEGAATNMMFSLGQDSHLATLARKRMSCRGFSVKPVDIDHLGHILTTGYDLVEHSTPSAGNMYPLKIYVILTRDLSDARLTVGHYEYDPARRQLVKYQDQVDLERLQFCFNSDTLLYDAPILVIIAADMLRQPTKYSNRGHRFTILEAGHAAENMLLAAQEVDIVGLEYGGFQDHVLADELTMQDHELPIITLAFGHYDLPHFDAAHWLEMLEQELVGDGRILEGVGISMGNKHGNGETFFGATAYYNYIHPRDVEETGSADERTRYTHGSATSTALAQLKAIAEAYERYVSGQWRVDRVAAATELTVPWLDPHTVAPFTPEQYAAQPYLQQFNKTAAWEWVQGERLEDGSLVLVPVDLVFYPLTSGILGRKPCYEAHSSGVAAFTTREQAIERALLELIERDAVMRSWLSKQPPQVIPERLLPYTYQRKVAEWRTNGRKVYVLDHSAHGVIVTGVVIVSEDYPSFVSGAAASLQSLDEALAKAFQEAEFHLIQSRKAPAVPRIAAEEVSSPADHAAFYYYPDRLNSLSWLWNGSEATALPSVHTTIHSLAATLQPVVVDLANDSQLKVVRVLCDQLVPISFGFGRQHFTHSVVYDTVDSANLRFPHYFA